MRIEMFRATLPSRQRCQCSVQTEDTSAEGYSLPQSTTMGEATDLPAKLKDLAARNGLRNNEKAHYLSFHAHKFLAQAHLAAKQTALLQRLSARTSTTRAASTVV